ncbi:Cytochrome c oxidase polypeptide Vb [Zea mays]|uniref:Cytochrome c oxidase polypeptide Vb n=1 Tax=Zea mays TaxID=4577 RepID=A0A1D6NLZ4_MAIZE|nr:Cytochrome c oxidase polypeptide Vb [Zea mays]
MWRRLHTLAPALRRATAAAAGAPAASASSAARAAPLSSAAAAFRRTSPLLSGDKPASVEDVMPIATGLEREELEAELKGKKRFDMDPLVGPFGTKVSWP